MKTRSPKKLSSVVVLLLLAGLALGYFIHVRPKQAVARYKAELLARGEKLSMAELLPPVPPRAVDGTEALRRVMAFSRNSSCLLDTNMPKPMEMMAPGRALAGWQQTIIVDLFAKPPATNDWNEIAVALAARRETLDGLATLVERPAVDWQLNYEEGFSMLLPHLAPMKHLAQYAQTAALLELRQKNPAAAVQHLRVMLALVKGAGEERLIISQLVRIAIANLAFGATWSVLQAPDLTDEQLAALQADWAAMDFNAPMENALAMERALAEMTLDRMRNSSAEFRKVTTAFGGGGGGGGAATSGDWMEQAGVMVSQGWDATKRKAQESAWRVSWSLTDELTALKGHQVMLDTTRAARSNGCYLPAILVQRARLVELGITNKPDPEMNLFGDDPDVRTLFTGSLVSLGKTLDKVMAAQTARQIAMTGIALRRYQLRHGRYPTNLALLTPEFLPETPRDPVDGKPLRYRPADGDSFVFYSIGKDGVDNGGDAVNPNKNDSFLWQSGRDWVWPRPASTAEAAAYFAAQVKKAAR